MKKLKAMIVDDSELIRMILMNTLAGAGLAEFEFVEAEDGVEALEKFDAKEIHVIFTDWNMPRMNGIEFARKVRSNKKHLHIPIVMVTGEQTVGNMNEALGQAGAAAFICKPFTIQDLQRKLAKVIEAIPEPKIKPTGFLARLVY